MLFFSACGPVAGADNLDSASSARLLARDRRWFPHPAEAAPMFAPEPDSAWLLEAWWRCLNSEFLHGRQECRRLAHGFVGWNLARDLADFFWELANTRALLPGGVAAEDVDAWLLDPAAAGRRDDLIWAVARDEMEAGPDRNHPWRRIHLWLGREAVLHVLTGSDMQTLAYTWALRDFQEAAPTGPGLAKAYQGRNDTSRTAFQKWWVDALNRLVTWLRAETWGRLRDLTWDAWVGLLARILDVGEPCPGNPPCPLTQLVVAKNTQWQRGLAQRALDTALPVSQGWFVEMARRLLAAQEGGYPLRWSPDDLRQWIRLWRWAQANDLDVGLRDLKLPDPDAVDVPATIFSDALDNLVGWFNRLQRQREELHAGRPYAEDLFGQPDPP